jgi:hypothetical protein
VCSIAPRPLTAAKRGWENGFSDWTEEFHEKLDIATFLAGCEKTMFVRENFDDPHV